MKFALLPPYRTGAVAEPEWITRFAQHAEACGFDAIYTVEHAVVPVGYQSKYPYAPDGRMTLPDHADIPDPLDLLAFLAARTTKLGLGTGLIVLPEHHPVQLAKRLATIDKLSGGRLTIGVGVGWLREELEALNIDPTSRGRRTDECIEALRVLWREDEPTFHGEFFNFDKACSHPKPVQPNGVKIHIGGHSAAAARRAGRLGDGFHPLGLAGDALTERVAQMREAAEQAGREPDSIELTLGGLLDRLDDDGLAVMQKAGAVRLVMSTRITDIDAMCDQMSEFAERFIA
ncbi:MAG TPA: LLM class F420-dependent oxidoreductase [Acidimicrobiales bacterium]|nr:LLM class F420-dependent oxidoreductase [Acidimicrobiales bacterium]